ncbi:MULTISPECIES: N-acetylglucosamine kinase [unclassified Paenibacillus]|uniref:N-acetylglucosamine kinase n=1 Tax=unclassified Paenibacillus TaxID=185978 RepID=UPI0036D28F0E
MNSSVVIGIDGGGTHTRVMVCDLKGQELARLDSKEAASLYKDRNAVQNVRRAIVNALQIAGRGVEDVRHLAAGIAGYDTPEDLSWVAELTSIPGLSCPQTLVNDAIAAHAGALLGKPGIIAISGTGSIIVGVTESGRQIRNYDFHHYALSAARSIAYEAVYELLAGHGDESDRELAQSALSHFDAESVLDLAEQARRGFGENKQDRDRHFGRFAPAVTIAAERGSSIAKLVCSRAVDGLATGIEIIASAFESEEVDVAFIGSVLSGRYVSRELAARLADGKNKRYRVLPPGLDPVAGAVLLALKGAGASVSELTLVTRCS